MPCCQSPTVTHQHKLLLKKFRRVDYYIYNVFWKVPIFLKKKIPRWKLVYIRFKYKYFSTNRNSCHGWANPGIRTPEGMEFTSNTWCTMWPHPTRACVLTHPERLLPYLRAVCVGRLVGISRDGTRFQGLNSPDELKWDRYDIKKTFFSSVIS